MNIKLVSLRAAAVCAVATLSGWTANQANAQALVNEPAKVYWSHADADNTDQPTVILPEDGFTVTSFDLNGAKGVGYEGVNWCDYKFIKIQPANGESDPVTWSVKPAKGLVFTPAKISAYITKFGTDAAKEKTVVTGRTKEGEALQLGIYTAARNNRQQADDKFGKEPTYAQHFTIELTEEQQKQLTTAEGFELDITLGVNNAKQAGFSRVVIEGVLNGEKIAVVKYPVSIAANPAEGGTVSVKPQAEAYDEGTEIALSAVEKFGYDFVNWTDSKGNTVSETPDFTTTVTGEETLTANFKAVATYELKTAVEGGANDYMVILTPAPTVVDGRQMYEEGTTVTLEALSNPVVTFTNWSNGETAAATTVTMDADKDMTAEYAAADYIVGWDFWRAGGNGRPADFAFEENDAVTLNLRTAEGDNSSWLDKSQLGAGGYEGRPAAVNWRTTGLGDYYWQAKFNAAAFKNLRVITAMAYNYNAYTGQDVEASTDGENWTKLGTITINGAKNWTDAEFGFPAEFDNKAEVYIRWIADKTSKVDGTSSNNDGIALGASYIVGEKELVNDGTAPVLVSTVPAQGAANASTNGKIVLNFDEKVALAEGATALLNGKELAGTASGKSVVFPYKNLAFNTEYEFTLAGNTVADLTANYMTEPVAITFTTRTRPEVAKESLDFVVPDDGDFRAAITAANERKDQTKRFRIFVRNGHYMIPMDPSHPVNVNGGTFPDVTLRLTGSNVSIIGESREGTVIVNEVPDMDGVGSHPMEGIGNADLLQIQGNVTGTYIQDITLKHGIGDNRGRNIVLQDKGNKTVMKNVCLWGYQDTWTSNNQNARYYVEGGVMRGRTDYLCGKGDAYFSAVTLQMCGNGYLAVPSVPKKYGWIFRDCEITGENSTLDGNYTLGRPWGSGTPVALFIDTRMVVKPSAIGWADMGSDGYPARFAEYNSTTASGTVIDLSERKKTFGSGNHPNNPVLTKEEADTYTYETVIGGDDDWDPALDCEQAPAVQNLSLNDGFLTWDDNSYTLCWSVYDGETLLGFTTEPTFAVSATRGEADYTVRAHNEMGGAGEKSGTATSGIASAAADGNGAAKYYNMQGIEVSNPAEGQVVVKVTRNSNGTVTACKVVK